MLSTTLRSAALLAASVALVLASGGPCAAQASGAEPPSVSSLFSIPQPPPALHLVLERAGFDVLHGAGPSGDLQVVAMPVEEPALLRLAPNAVRIARGRPFAEIAAGRAGVVPDPGYYTVAEIEQEIDALVAMAPAIARKVDLTTLPGGQRTHGNRPIFALVVSDDVATEEDEPAVLIAAQHHARELNAPHIVVGAMRRVVTGYATDPALRAAVDASEIWFVPMVNPDGVDHVWNVDNFWRKNRRDNRDGSFGVDLNRNFDFLWQSACDGSTRTTSQTYRGPSPASEPETRTMQNLGRLLAPEVYLDIHSFGQEVLFTYAPCASVDPALRTYLLRYADDLRAPMGYRFRDPSSSGQAPQHHWARNGTMSFLIEVGTSFQPAFSTTVQEEARVWPGIRRALTAWAPAVRGHVRSIAGGVPLEASITVSPNRFRLGETNRSRARDGRFALWLAPGSWQVTVSAPGHLPRTFPVQVVGYDNPQPLEVELVPDLPLPTLTASGPVRIGTTLGLRLDASGDAGRPYAVLLAGSSTPGIPVGPRTVPLAADGVLAESVASALGGTLTNHIGVLAASERADATFQIPRVPALVGVSLVAGGLTFDPTWPESVKGITAALTLTFVP